MTDETNPFLPAADASAPSTEENPFLKGLAQQKNADDLKANPENPFLLDLVAKDKGVQLDKTAPVGSPGFLGGMADVGRGLAHGAIVDLPQQVGQSAQNFGRELGNQGLAQWGDETVAAAKARDEAHPEFKQSQVGQLAADDWSSVRGGAYGAGSNTPLSTGPGLGAAGIGAAIGSVVPGIGTMAGAAAGYVVGSLASLPLFYGGQGQQSYEEIKKRLTAQGGHTPEEIEHAATVGGRLSGATEAGGELIEDAIPFHQLFHPLAKPVKGMLVKSLFSGGLRKAAATIGAQELGEVSTETAQQYLEDEIEGRYGGGKGGSLHEAAKVIMPTALMTLLPGGLTAAHSFHTTRQLKNSLIDPGLSDERRTAAAKVVFHQIADQDPETAQAFSEYSAVQIAAKQPITLGSDEFYKSAVERPDYQAALTHLEENAGDYAGAQAHLDQDHPPTYAVQEGEAESIDAAPPPDSTPGYTVQELAPDTPLGNAATIAQATGAAQNAAAARQTEVDESTHAAAGKNATEGDSEPPAPPPANPITGALFPFAKADAAQSRAQLLQEQTGQPHTVIPHPFKHDAFAVVPGANESIEAAPAPGDNKPETQGRAGDKTPETQGDRNDVQLPAAARTKEAPRDQRPGENIQGNPQDESRPQGPGEGPGGAAQGEKGAVTVLPGGERVDAETGEILPGLASEEEAARATAGLQARAQESTRRGAPQAPEAPPTTGPGTTTPEKVQTTTGGPQQPYSEHHVLTWPAGTRISLGDPGYPGHKRPATIVGHDERGNPQIRIDKTGKTRPLSGNDTVWRLRPEDEPTTTTAAPTTEKKVQGEPTPAPSKAGTEAAAKVSDTGPWDFENSWPSPIPDAEMERAGRQGFAGMQADVEGGASLHEAVAETLTETANEALQHLHTIRALQGAIKTGIPPGKDKPLSEAKLTEQRKRWWAELRQARQDYQDQVAAVEEYFPHPAVHAWSQWVGRTFAEQQPEFEKEPTPEQRAQMEKARANDEAKMARVGKKAERASTPGNSEIQGVDKPPKWWTDSTPNERYWILQASGIKGTAATPWGRISAADRQALNEQWGKSSPMAQDVVNGKPVDPNLSGDERLVFMACSQEKAATGGTPLHLYRGAMWDVLRKWLPKGEAKPHIVTLSAKHEVVFEDETIRPYEQKLTPERADQLIKRGFPKSASFTQTFKDVFLAGPAEYQRVMKSYLRELMDAGIIAPDASINAVSGGIGEQRGALADYLKSISSGGKEEEAAPAAAPAFAPTGKEKFQAGDNVWLATPYTGEDEKRRKVLGADGKYHYAYEKVQSTGSSRSPGWTVIGYTPDGVHIRGAELQQVDGRPQHVTVDKIVPEDALSNPRKAAVTPQVPALDGMTPLGTKERDRFDAHSDTPNAAETELRALSHADDRTGDVLLMGSRYVAFDDAVRFAREMIAAHPSTATMPAQLHTRLGLAGRDLDRVLEAANQPAPAPSARFAKNKLFTASDVEKARAILKKKLGNLSAGIDPEAMQAGMTIAGAYIEDGVRTFAAFSKAMVDDLGEAIRPYLRSLYEGVRHWPGLDTAGMSSAEDIEAVLRGLTDEPTMAPGATDEHPSTGRPGAETLGQVPAAENGSTGGGGDVRGGNAGGRSARPGRNKSAGNAGGVSAPRGGRSGAATVHSPAPGAKRAQRPGAKGPGSSAQSDASNPVAIPAADFVITQDLNLGSGGEVQKYNDNVAAIRALKAIESDNRRATPDEQRLLARYVGWGGLHNAFADQEGNLKPEWDARGKALAELLTPRELANARNSTRNAHYTSETVVRAMWAGLQRMGFKGGLVLEPSAGSGNFLGLRPDGPMKFIAIEYDSLTARIAALLYPQQTVLHAPFQDVPLPSGAFDLAIGNPPFGAESLFFQHKPELRGASIHNQFFRGSLDTLKPQGLLAMVVSRYLMDAKDTSQRAALAREGELVAAIRLPDTAFKGNAGTDVVTDIVILRKLDGGDRARMASIVDAYQSQPKREAREESQRRSLAAQIPEWVETAEVKDPLGGTPIVINKYFARDTRQILGRLERSGTMQARGENGERQPNVALQPGQDFGAMLQAAIERLPENLTGQDDATIARSLDRYQRLAEALPLAISGKEVGHIEHDADGKLHQLVEREAPEENHFELTKRELTAESPWSPSLLLDSSGHWYKLDQLLDDKGAPRKVLDAKGKPTKRNLYGRIVYASDADVPASMRLGESRFERLTQLAKIRDLLKTQLTMEADDRPTAELEANRAKLRTAYETFVQAHGFTNDPRNASLVSEMPDGALLLALEMQYRPAITEAKAEKLGMQPAPAHADPAPILSERVVVPYEPPSRAGSVQDALAISLAERGAIDVERIASLLHTTQQDATAKLLEGETPLAFFDPETERPVTRNDYLSGNVRRKLAAARAANLERNAAELEKVQPAPWGAENVTVQMGATWVPAKHYADFLTHLTNSPATVVFGKLTNTFSVQVSDSTPKAREWSTGRKTVGEIVAALLNSSSIRVVDYDTDGSAHPNVEETELAQLKAREIRSEFAEWVFQDADRRNQLVQIFNDKFNTRVNRQHDGTFLTLPGKVPDAIIELRRHQKNAIWRGISERFMLLDHVVGAGKTFTLIGRAMERRRMGLSNKPVIVVPNHLVESWAAEVYRLYPGAKVLAAGKDDFSKNRRRRLFAKVATGDWDLVIMPHSSFRFIAISPEAEQRFLAHELELATEAVKDAWDEAEAAGQVQGKRKPLGVKDAERLVTSIETRLAALNQRGSRDNLLTFEQMGIDDLSVDEAHEYKNLFYSSRLTNVRGMGDKAGSQKAFDLYNKIRILRENGGTVTFATGTPISNSAVEMYTVMRYLAADDLKDLGLEHFDAWRAQYVDVDAAWEPTEQGNSLKEVNRLGRTWSNMRSLMELYYSFTDAVSNDDIKRWFAEDNAGRAFPIPPVKGGERQRIIVKPTPAQEQQLTDVIAGFNALPSIKDPIERASERLRLMDRARKISLDARALDRRLDTTEPGGKLERASNEIARIYKAWQEDKGTQLVFLDRSVPKARGDDKIIKAYDDLVQKRDDALRAGDEDGYREAAEAMEKYDPNEIAELRLAQTGGWNAYQQLKDNLVARGIPANEIRFIQEASTDQQKKAMFDAVNDGDVRVLIGSTPRMGAGTNVQERLVGLHHIDVGWKPSEVEQREGRIIRQGNSLLTKYGDQFAVEIVAYATERTIDAKMWDLNATKLKTINGIRSYDGSFTMDFEDEEAIGMAEMAALASGDPLLLERVKLSAELDRLELQQRAHRRKIYGIQDDIKRLEKWEQDGAAMIDRARAQAAPVREVYDQVAAAKAARKVSVDGKEYTGAFAAETAAMSAREAQQAGDEKAKYAVEVGGQPRTSKDAITKAIDAALGDHDEFEVKVGDGTYIMRTAGAGAIATKLSDESAALSDVGERTVRLGTMLGAELVADIAPTRKENHYGLVLSLVDGNGRTIASAESLGASPNAFQWAPTTVSSVLSRLWDYAVAVAHPESQVSYIESQMREAEAHLPSLRERLTQPWAGEPELVQKRARLQEVVSALTSNTPPPSQLDLAGGSGPGMPALRVRALAQVLSKTWHNAPTIHVVQAVGELPFTAPPKTRGGFWNGQVYLVADNLADRRAAEFVLLHETMGHYGLQGVFGHQLDGLMQQIYATNPSVREGADARRAHYQANGRTISQALAVEETLADMAGRGELEAVHGWKLLVAALRRILRTLGFNLAMSDNDVADLLRQASQYVQRPAALPPPGRAASTVPAFQAQEPAHRFMPARYAPDMYAVKDMHPDGVGIAAWFGTQEEAEAYAKLLNEKLGPAFSMAKPPFYSQLLVGMAKAPFAKDGTIDAKQLAAWVEARAREGVFKKDEVEWSGLNDWLGMGGRMTRDQVTDFLVNMGTRIDETLLGENGSANDELDRLRVQLDARGYNLRFDMEGYLSELEHRQPDNAAGVTGTWYTFDHDEGAFLNEETKAPLPAEVKSIVDRFTQLEAEGSPMARAETSGFSRYEQWQLPGGRNYRELLLTLPVSAQQSALLTQHEPEELPGGAAALGVFRSSHFAELNIVAHLRFNERTDADGKRVLFLEEIQSDWAQAGRTKGFKGRGATPAELAEYKAITDKMHREGEIRGADVERMNELGALIRNDGVPVAPFVQDTKAWVALALKRAVRYAADNGFDRIAWTTGQQQADRYDLSRHITRIEWQDGDGPNGLRTVVLVPNNAGAVIMGVDRHTGLVRDGSGEFMRKPLEDVIGKELAKRVLEAREDKGVLQGLDLKVGGEGMYAFYDKIVPQVARDLLRKFGGGELGQVAIALPTHARELPSEIGGEYGPAALTQPGFDITPALREKAADGLPLFSLMTDGPTGAVVQYLNDTLRSPKSFGPLQGFQTQLHKALTQPFFRPVYQAVQRFLLDTSRFANDAAELAGSDVLPRLRNAAEAFSVKDLLPQRRRDLEAVGKVTMLGTLGDIRPTAAELASGFDVTDPNTGTVTRAPALTESQIAMWHNVRAGLDLALDQAAASEMIRITTGEGIDGARADARQDPQSAKATLLLALEPTVAPLRDRALALAELATEAKSEVTRLQQAVKNEPDAAVKATLRSALKEAKKDLARKDRAARRADQAYRAKQAVVDGILALDARLAELKAQGYAPLMRFGEYTVNVTVPGEREGTRKEVFFSMYESKPDMYQAQRDLQEEFGPEAFVTVGTMDQSSYKLFKGLSLDALAAFANVTGLSAKSEFQEFYKLALSSRSALKRLIHRKGIAGYSEDLPRVLATYFTGNARLASRNIHMGEATQAALAIPKELGQLKTDAANLIDYVQNPTEEASALRGFLYVNFLGGSIAAAAVNATQPVMMTAPWLSQYSAPFQAVRALTGALKVGLHGIPSDVALQEALQQAEREGITEPQEIHQLYAESIRNGWTSNLLWRKFARVWGSFFSLAESFNRRITFGAAWRLANDVGLEQINAVRTRIGLPTVTDAYDFARAAVDETQGVYNRGNRPNLARGPVGATVFTFKQFSIAYLEFLSRLPAREKAFAIALLVLAAGVQGLPGADDLADLWDAFGQMLGFSTNSKKAMRQWAIQHLGSVAGPFLTQGLSGIPGSPIDVSQRLGFNNLVPGLNLLKRSDEGREASGGGALGAAGSFGNQLIKGWQALEEKQYGQAAASALPIAIQNGLKAADMWHSGYYRDVKGRRVVPVSQGDALSKLLGFQPYDVADAQQAASAVQQDVALEKNVEQGIANRMARARVDNDPAGFQAAQQDLLTWNARNPTNMIRITPEQIASHVKNLLMERKLRLIKTAPPEARAGVARDLQ